MLKKLKGKFIRVSMLAVTLVLLLIMGTINITNYESTKQSAEQLLNILADNEGVFPQPEKPADNHPSAVTPPSTDNPPLSADVPPHKEDTFSPEAPFNTRYFTVTLDTSGTTDTIADTNVTNIAAISSETAGSYAEELFVKGKVSGYIGNYRYRQVTCSNGDCMYIFLDCERDLQSFHNFLTASLLISLAGLLLIFILLLIFSGIAVHPIVESYEKQKRFITDASHEIKTPLAIIDANTDVIEMEHGESSWTASTKKQVERLTSLTEKLVLLSKMDEAQPRIEMQPVPVTELLTDTLDSFDAVCATRHITLTASIEPSVTLNGNADTLQQAFTMLIDNAVKYSDGSISVTLQKRGRIARLTFANSVAEIKPGRHNELFERFYRPDTSRNTQTGGFGIGLSTVKAIVEAHKGKVSARAADAHSIQFVLILPL